MNQFLKKRVKEIKLLHHVIIGVVSINNNSTVRNISQFTRKSSISYPPISLAYAFDLESMEPLTTKAYMGNDITTSDFEEFLLDNELTTGILLDNYLQTTFLADKIRSKYPKIHYLFSVEENSPLVRKYNMLDYDTAVPGYAGVLGKKVCVGGIWHYSFPDCYNYVVCGGEYADEKRTFIKDPACKIPSKFSNSIIFESDLDLELEIIYKMYVNHGIIEMMLNTNKIQFNNNVACLDSCTRLVAIEFINYLSTIIMGRLIRRFDECNLFEVWSYGELMGILKNAEKKNGTEGMLGTIRMLEKYVNILEKLELTKNLAVTRNPVGRPRKSIL